jgi:cold shock CspA family protein
MSSTDDVQSERLLGQVKWFNNKAGYGFITVNDGEHSGKDIFIHYSTIRTTNSQYKYLVQGEYVEFNLVKSTTENHEYQAVDISGIKGGPLMCETRRMNRGPEATEPPLVSRSADGPRRRYKTPDDSERPQRSNRAPHPDRGQDGEGYQVVRKRPRTTRAPTKKDSLVSTSE